MAHGSSPRTIAQARALRRDQTPTEKCLWRHLRAGQVSGYKFRRQHPIGKFVADFCCEESRLVVEIDGDSHAEQEAYDRERTHELNELGYRVVRFTNRDVLHRMDGVLEVILKACEERQR